MKIKYNFCWGNQLKFIVWFSLKLIYWSLFGTCKIIQIWIVNKNKITLNWNKNKIRLYFEIKLKN